MEKEKRLRITHNVRARKPIVTETTAEIIYIGPRYSVPGETVPETEEAYVRLRTEDKEA